ncbi:MAG: hypothetical protein LBG73_04630, partial [Spirochaetaceae bacterium]|nr:hypothetical protein [Spirochaetaceae bacterium]
DIRLADLAPDADYRCYYELTYYAFGDSDSMSSPWGIRRCVTGGLDRPYGGEVLVRHGGNCDFYVHIICVTACKDT